MLTHLEALLRVAGAELADAYPKQVAKIAAALQKAPEVAGALPHLPDDARESLKAMLVLLATAGTDASVSEQLRQRQAASEEEGGAFENRVDEIMNNDWNTRPEMQVALRPHETVLPRLSLFGDSICSPPLEALWRPGVDRWEGTEVSPLDRPPCVLSSYVPPFCSKKPSITSSRTSA